MDLSLSLSLSLSDNNLIFTEGKNLYKNSINSIKYLFNQWAGLPQDMLLYVLYIVLIDAMDIVVPAKKDKVSNELKTLV